MTCFAAVIICTMVFKASVKRRLGDAKASKRPPSALEKQPLWATRRLMRPLRRRLGVKAPLFRLRTPYRFKNHDLHRIKISILYFMTHRTKILTCNTTTTTLKISCYQHPNWHHEYTKIKLQLEDHITTSMNSLLLETI
jgi:hypothetical protein